MGHWALVKIAVSVLPAGAGREAALRHVDRCPSCRARQASREEARRALVRAEDLGRLDPLWPSVFRAMKGRPIPAEGSPDVRAPRRVSGPLRWAAAAGGVAGAAAAILLVLGTWPLRGPDAAAGIVPAADSLSILSASVAGRPAELYVVEVPEDRMVLVWVEKRPGQGEPS